MERICHWLCAALCLVVCTSAAVAQNCEPELLVDLNAHHAHALGSSLKMTSLAERLEILSGERELPGHFSLRDRGSVAGRMLTRLVLQRFIEELGYTVQFEDFLRPVAGSNLIVEIPGFGQPDQVVEVTSHYDSVGNPGADDNGSGTALMLEMLDHFRGARFARTLRFVFMDLEENDFHGSAFHARKIKEDPREFLGAIVVDTIGWALDGGLHYLGVMEIGTLQPGANPQVYADRVKFALELFYQLKRIGSRERLVISPETDLAQPDTGDHGSYWKEGLPAVLIAAPYEPGFINPHYHEPTDRMKNINWNYYSLMARTVAELVAFAARGEMVAIDSVPPEVWTAIASTENQSIREGALDLIPPSASREAALPPGFEPQKPWYQAWPKLPGAVKMFVLRAWSRLHQ